MISSLPFHFLLLLSFPFSLYILFYCGMSVYIHVLCNNCSVYLPVDYIKHLDEQSMDKDDSESKKMLIYM